MATSCAPPPHLFTPRSDRLPLIREAFRLEWLTIGWMTVEAVVAIGAGVTAGSLVLIAFGLDSVIELASASVLMWRLSVELRHGQVFSERAERTARRIGGGLLFLLAAYVTVAALRQLWSGTGEEFSWLGFIVALVAIPAMSYLAHRKIAIAEKIGSRALRADAMEAMTCGWLSFVVVVSRPSPAKTGIFARCLFIAGCWCAVAMNCPENSGWRPAEHSQEARMECGTGPSQWSNNGHFTDSRRSPPIGEKVRIDDNTAYGYL